MKKPSKEIIILIIGIFILCGLYFCYHVLDISQYNIGPLSHEYVGFVFVICVVIIIYNIVIFINGRLNPGETQYQEKLFNSLFKSSDTIYVMFDSKMSQIIYMTKNVNRVLNGDLSDDKRREITKVKDIFNLSIIDNDLKKWDKRSEYLSPIVAYKPNTKWLRIKIYPLHDKKKLYYICLINDATKDHTNTHFLVSQASEIKEREKVLNEVIVSSYDTEVDVDLDTGIAKFIDLKKHHDYDDEVSFDYDEYLRDKILKHVSYDKEVEEKLSLKNLRTMKNSFMLRYRLDNDQEKVWLESSVFYMNNSKNNKATILTKNVTEDAESIRKQNILLENALNEAKKANDSKTEFLKTISHEIRNPMNVIMGLSSSILEEKINDEIRDDVLSINSASQNILGIIDDLLDIKQVEKGKIVIKNKEYSMSELIEDIYNIVDKSIDSKDVKLTLKLNRSIPSVLIGDNSKIRQVLLSILDNSVKFTDQGSIIFRVDCERVNSKVKLIFLIQDSGIGMTSKELNDLYSHKGSSLNIASKIIKELDGVIDVSSTVGIGTSVSLTITQDIADDKPIGNILDNHSNDTNKDIKFNNKKVLIVDDDALNLKVATKILSKYGITIATVHSGKDCLQKVKNTVYDLILLDQKMPDMDGITTMKELRKDDTFKTPVVVLTADAMKGAAERYKKEGFDDYLAKPINRNKLIEILENYLEDSNEE